MHHTNSENNPPCKIRPRTQAACGDHSLAPSLLEADVAATVAGTRVARRDSHSGAKLAGQAGEGGEGSALGLSRGSVVGQGRHAGCQNGRARHTHSIAHCRTCTRTNHTPSVPGDKHTDTPPTVLRHNRTCRHKAGRHARKVMGGQKKQNVRVNNEALFFLSLSF